MILQWYDVELWAGGVHCEIIPVEHYGNLIRLILFSQLTVDAEDSWVLTGRRIIKISYQSLNLGLTGIR